MPKVTHVIVTGDLLEDHNLIRHRLAPNRHHVPFPCALMNEQAGGAWYTASLLKPICDRPGNTLVNHTVTLDDASKAGTINQAFTLWSPYEAVSRKGQVWRGSEFLGCQQAHYAGVTSGQAVPTFQFKNVRSPNLVILDDMCLGFRDRPEMWPAEIKKKSSRTPFILKTSFPLTPSKLWDHMLTHHARQLTVVLSVEALRARGAGISRGLSWDRTLEDLQHEFQHGESSRDLARASRTVILLHAEAMCVFAGKRLERFVFHPDQTEGCTRASLPGHSFGALSLATACTARHLLDPDGFPLFVTLARTLSAIRENHFAGAGSVTLKDQDTAGFKPDSAWRDAALPILNPCDDTKLKDYIKDDKLPERAYGAAYHPSILSSWDTRRESNHRLSLLARVTGQGYECMYAKALEIVQTGVDQALQSVPCARYGNYLTVDRVEIERINELRKLILDYRDDAGDKRPLSIAVFGQPGSGKSFAIKQLAKTIFGKDHPIITFNLSQFSGGVHELCRALQKVRDASVKGAMPLIIWDEFDTDHLKWLKDFLAPMQDAEFVEGGDVHPLGKSIFIFAGGTCHCFEDFDRHDDAFKALKGPDFVSRLRGYLDVKGPNPSDQKPVKDNRRSLDQAHVVRRAILFRSMLERNAGHLIDPLSDRAAVDPRILRAVLRVHEFKHGARSMEALITMSALDHEERFGLDALPSKELLRLHVADDFSEFLQTAEVSTADIEILAQGLHDAWCAEKKNQGFTYGKVTDKTKKTNQYLCPYTDLDESGKELNRIPARNTMAALLHADYNLIPRHTSPRGYQEVKSLSGAALTTLVEEQHDIWLRDRLSRGTVLGSKVVDRLQIHHDACPFHKLPAAHIAYDRQIAKSFPALLKTVGFKIVKKQATPGKRGNAG